MEQLTGLKKMRFKLQHYDTEKQKDKRLYLPFCFSIKFSEKQKIRTHRLQAQGSDLFVMVGPQGLEPWTGRL